MQASTGSPVTRWRPIAASVSFNGKSALVAVSGGVEPIITCQPMSKRTDGSALLVLIPASCAAQKNALRAAGSPWEKRSIAELRTFSRRRYR